jgi:uncharacterized protein with FMN-binding domain
MTKQTNVPIRPRDTASKLTTALTLFILADIAVGGVIIFHNSFKKSEPQQIATAPVSNSSGASMNTSSYKNGQYTKLVSYMSSDGQEQITVSLMLNNGTITSASITPNANNPTSAAYISKFINGYQPLVVGQKISSLKLSTVAGASHTTTAFNDAITQIQAQAQI